MQELFHVLMLQESQLKKCAVDLLRLLLKEYRFNGRRIMAQWNQETYEDSFTKFCFEFPEQGVKVLQRIASTMSGRVRKGNEDVLKLTTALSLALSK